MRAPQEEIVRDHAYGDKAKLSPARIFKSPMDVVETNDIGPAEKLAILQAWEADERALLRAEDEGMGSTRIFTRCKLPSTISGKRPAQRRIGSSYFFSFGFAGATR
jgi:hypothetical protein